MNRLYLGLGTAAALWGVVFALEPLNFWTDITAATLIVAAFALCFGREDLKAAVSYRAGMIMAGIGGAAILYVIFVIGSWASRQILPFAPDQIASIYEIRDTAPRWAVVMLLAVIIAPCEEIFWRGYVQSTLAFNIGDARGWLLMAAAYALIHAWSWNLILVGSAFVCGLVWGLLFYRLKSLIPCIISHVLWDLAVFVYYPILE
jgi:membrane protease YdiL (CAAX protease family)